MLRCTANLLNPRAWRRANRVRIRRRENALALRLWT
jgi:hypothetical protein